jgi:hypothetical protein
MAFIGTAVVKQVSDSIVRITGLSLAFGQSGTIGLFGRTLSPDVRLPEPFKTVGYAAEGSPVPLQDAIECTSKDAGVTPNTPAVPIAIVKSGTTTADFTITITNTDAAATTANQEIMVKLHD